VSLPPWLLRRSGRGLRRSGRRSRRLARPPRVPLVAGGPRGPLFDGGRRGWVRSAGGPEDDGSADDHHAPAGGLGRGHGGAGRECPGIGRQTRLHQLHHRVPHPGDDGYLGGRVGQGVHPPLEVGLVGLVQEYRRRVTRIHGPPQLLGQEPVPPGRPGEPAAGARFDRAAHHDGVVHLGHHDREAPRFLHPDQPDSQHPALLRSDLSRLPAGCEELIRGAGKRRS